MGLPKFLTYLFLHATACGLRRISINLAITVNLVLPSGPLRPSASATTPISKLYQHFRGRGSPYGLQDSLSTLHLSCSSQSSRLRHRRKTRYGWVANPYPARTFTLQDTPSFAWRDNGSADDLRAKRNRSICLLCPRQYFRMFTGLPAGVRYFHEIGMPTFLTMQLKR